MLTFVLTVETR